MSYKIQIALFLVRIFISPAIKEQQQQTWNRDRIATSFAVIIGWAVVSEKSIANISLKSDSPHLTFNMLEQIVEKLVAST